MVLEHQLLRCKPPRFSANDNSIALPRHIRRPPMPPEPQVSNIVIVGQPQVSLSNGTGTGMKIRFVRVEDSLFKVPETFFLQMPPDLQEETKFKAGLGKTPERPILLSGHSSHQFRLLLKAYTSYPQVDQKDMSLDQFLTIGELTHRYCTRDLAFWFLPIFKDLVMSHQTPLRKCPNSIYVRTMKLAVAYGSTELCASISTKWVSRMHWRQLDPHSAMFFADAYGLRDLLSHACYIYLMLVYKRIKNNEKFDTQGLLTPRQRTYIMSGYHSLSAYWNHLRQNPIDFEMAAHCGSHMQCIGAWRLRWVVATDKECPLPDVDILGRLTFLERCLRDDMLLSVVLTPGCKESALRSISQKRETASRHLHHHFDL